MVYSVMVTITIGWLLAMVALWVFERLWLEPVLEKHMEWL